MSTQPKKISGKKVAILATDGFEQVELTEPKTSLEKAGATVDVISIKPGEIKGWDFTDWGESVKVDHLVNEVKPSDYDALSSYPAVDPTPTTSVSISPP